MKNELASSTKYNSPSQTTTPLPKIKNTLNSFKNPKFQNSNFPLFPLTLTLVRGRTLRHDQLKGTLLDLRQISTTEITLEWWKIIFISSQNLFLFSRDLNFSLDFLFWSWRKTGWLEEQNFYQSLWHQSLVNKQMQHVFWNISSKKGNQTTKFSQLIEYNMKNIFLEISYTKWGGETINRPLSEWSKLSISLAHNFNSLKFYTISFYHMSSWRLSQYIENKLQTTCFCVI